MTNGGYGGVQTALAHGVPLVVAGRSEDKMEVSARVAWSGAGISLGTDTPTEDRIGDAVHTVLTVPSYREAARRLRDSYTRYDAAGRGAEIILGAAHRRAATQVDGPARVDIDRRLRLHHLACGDVERHVRPRVPGPMSCPPSL